jgi:hypothetical protein
MELNALLDVLEEGEALSPDDAPSQYAAPYRPGYCVVAPVTVAFVSTMGAVAVASKRGTEHRLGLPSAHP